MNGVRVRVLVATALAVGVAAWAVLDARDAAGASPVPVPWTGSVAVVLLAIAVLVSAREVRRWVAGTRERPMDALTAARIGVLSQAAAYTGAVLAGWYAAQAVVVLPDLVGDRRTRLVLAVLSAIAAVGLAAAGLTGQRWCRRPPDEDDGADDDTP